MHKIMVVDDDEDVRKVFRDILMLEGFAVALCPTGKEALAAAPKEKPALILLDMHLPDMYGMDVCRSLKTDPRTSHIPVIILTGEARDLEQRVEGLEIGADDYLFKPLDPKVLISRIRSILKLTTKRQSKETK